MQLPDHRPSIGAPAVRERTDVPARAWRAPGKASSVHGRAVVRNLVELHGGRVTATSAGTGHGSEFIVRLPTED